jgi:lysophospholipase
MIDAPLDPAFDPASRRALPRGGALSRWVAPDGWSLRRFDWPAGGMGGGGRGRLMFLNGRGDFIEKYLDTYRHLHDGGWSVTAIDWRGQGGSGRVGADPAVGHAVEFVPGVSDLAALWRDWSAAGQGPRAIVGHSMGGYLALRAMSEGAIRPDAAVLAAPMLGLRAPFGPRVGLRIARWMAAHGDPARAAWKDGARPGAGGRRRRLLTHDADRYADEGWWHERQPELKLGPPSWTWLAEAFAGTLALEADPRLDTLAVPTLMLVADADRLVDPRATRRIAGRMPAAETVAFGRESAHEILREADAVRRRALAAIDSFFDRHVPR